MKSFEVPVHYRSQLISTIKEKRKKSDRMKKDFAPTMIALGSRLQLFIARHFGFCYGVENAIEIAFNAVNENPDKRIFLLSEMIHNPQVNKDLQDLGVSFIMDTKGNQIIDWKEIQEEDIVIIPAFGTTLEIEDILKSKNIEPKKYNTTCPFVEKVWNRSEKIGQDGFTIIVHGKPNHEETRATFSHSQSHTPTVVVKDMGQTILLGKYIANELPLEQFYEDFKSQYSNGFDVKKDLQKIGVVNQTTMLASDTQGIADYLKNIMMQTYQLDDITIKTRFADTRDTLCYATNDNQTAVQEMLQTPADLAIVIGGYNSSNTSHLVELCEEILPTYFIKDANCLISIDEISHFDIHRKEIMNTIDFLPKKQPIKILITSGASCPDSMVEEVIYRLASLMNMEDDLNSFMLDFFEPEAS